MKYLFEKKYLAMRITIGFFIGIIFGFVMPGTAELLKPLGDIFMNLIKMIVVPVIFFSIASGMASMKDSKKLAKVGGKVFLVYAALVFVSCIVAAILTVVIQPGNVVSLSASGTFDASSVGKVSYADFFIGIVPSNIVSAMASDNYMQIIFFTVIFGFSLVALGKKVQNLTDIMGQFAETTYKMLDVIMNYAPIGVFSLIGYTSAKYGKELFGSLAMFIVTEILGCLLVFILLALVTKAYTGIKLGKLFKAMIPIFLNTASTNSSTGTIPITMDVVTNKLKLPSSIASFSISLGPTICKTGAAVYKVVLVIFVAQMLRVPLPLAQIFLLIVISTLLSVATPGIPGGGIATGAIILGMFGLPLDIMGAIAGIYRIIDIGNTTLNVSSQVFGTLMVAKSDEVWTPKQFNSPALCEEN